MTTLPDNKVMKRLFIGMMKTRLVEERIAALYAEQEIRCPVHLCTGQEAVASGVCESLKDTDRVLSTHRSHGHYLAKGGDLKKMLAEIYGRETGCCRGKGGSMHLVDIEAGFVGAVPIVGSTLPIAAGVAFAAEYSINERYDSWLTAVFFGDGATEEGVFHETLNVASLFSLPMLFVCENNFFSVYSPLSVRQPKTLDLCRLAESYGIQTDKGNGNDVVDVYQKAVFATESIRQCNGPFLLTFDTYRWREHCGPNFDNHIGYRTEAEFEHWKKRCPVAGFKARCIENGIFTEDDIASIERVLEQETDEAVSYAKESSFPDAAMASESVMAP